MFGLPADLKSRLTDYQRDQQRRGKFQQQCERDRQSFALSPGGSQFGFGTP